MVSHSPTSGELFYSKNQNSSSPSADLAWVVWGGDGQILCSYPPDNQLTNLKPNFSEPIFGEYSLYRHTLPFGLTLLCGSKIQTDEINRKAMYFNAITTGEFYGVWVLDLEYKFLFFNDHLKKMVKFFTGKDVQIGDDARNYLLEGQVNYTKFDAFALAIRGISSFKELQFLREGKQIWIEFSVNPIKSGDNIVGVIYMAKDITPRKITERELDITKNRFEAIVNGLSEGLVLILEKDLTISFFEGVECKRYHLKAEDFLAARSVSILSPDQADKFDHAALLALEGHSNSAEMQLSITQQYYRMNFMPLYQDGEVAQVLVVCINITAAKLAEEKLRKREQQLLKWFNSNTVGQLIWSIDGTVLDANPAFLNMIGYTADDLIHQKINVFEITTKETFDQSRKALESILLGKGVVVFYKEYIARNGQIVPVEVTAGLFEDSRDKGFSYVRNLTEFKRVENQLKAYEQRYLDITDKQKEVIFRITPDGTLVYANPAFARFMSVPETDFLGKSLYNYLNSNEVQIFEQMINSTIEHKQSTRFEIKHSKKNNTQHLWLRWDISPIEVSNQIIEIQCVGFDISDIKWAEAKIMEQNAILKTKNEQLQKLNLELDQFVSKVSHDLKSPLASLSGLLDLVSTINNDERLVEYFDFMKKSVKKLHNFIGDVLDMSRNSKLEVKKEPVDIQKLVNDIFEVQRYTEGSENITKSLTISQTAPLYTDARRLEAIFGNLISNAIRYSMPKPEPSFLKIEANIDENQAVFTFADNGMGIAPQHLDRIFDIFFRGTDKVPGSGLGLYIVKEAVSKLKGDVSVISELGQGTTFTVKIPNLSKDFLSN